MNKYNFEDYSLEGFYNNLFAIEPEISNKFVNDLKFNGEGYQYYSESSTIKELLHMHTIPRDKMLYGYEEIKKFYKERFPLGSDKRLSGGVHFHIFKGDYRGLETKDLQYKLVNCPLFLKIKGKKGYARDMRMCKLRLDTKIRTDCKTHAVAYKNTYHTHRREGRVNKNSIEFRCNNVFDSRLYGYYVGIMIATKEGIKFKKTSDLFREYCYEGNKHSYQGTDIDLSDIPGYRISDIDYQTMKHNTRIIIKTLCEHGLTNAAKALKEYCNEIGFKLNIKINEYDSFTQEIVEDGIRIEEITLYRDKYTNLLFANHNNYIDFIKDRLFNKLKSVGIPKGLIELNEEKLIKKYLKLLDKPKESTEVEQTNLF